MVEGLYTQKRNVTLNTKILATVASLPFANSIFNGYDMG